MRRADREVTEQDRILQIMADCDVCRLAFADGDYPYILPVNFGMDVVDGAVELYFHGATEGTKYRFMEVGAPVSFQMDCGHDLLLDAERGYCTMTFSSVCGRGTLEEIEDPEEKARALQVLCDHYHPEGFAYSHAAIPRTRVFKVKVTQLVGKVKA